MTMEPDRGAYVSDNQRTPSTAEVLADLNGQIQSLASSGRPLTRITNVSDEFGNTSQVEILTEDGRRYNELVSLRDSIYEAVDKDPSGRAADRVSASVAAQIAQQQRQLVESARQFDAEQEQQKKRDAETQRQNNLNATLDLLEAEIRRGEAAGADQTRKLTAAIEASNVERQAVDSNIGKALPAGTAYYPGLAPGGAISSLAQGMGLPFDGFATGGTMGLNPSALSGQITGAVGQPTAPGIDQSIINAAAALAGQGVPVVPPTPNGRAMRTPQNTNAGVM